MIADEAQCPSLALCGLFLFASAAAAQPIQVTPNVVSVTAPADTLISVGGYGGNIGIATASKMPFTFVGVQPSGEPDFAVVSPSSGIAPAGVQVALNPSVVPYMISGNYDLTLVFALADQPSSTYPIRLHLSLQGQGAPTTSAVLGAATLQPAISPGQVVSIFGTHLSTPPLYGQLSDAGVYPTTLGNTTVTFNGILAPLLYVSNGQINCMVPYGVAGQKTVDVVVARTGAPGISSPPVTLPLLDTSPGIFTADQTGTGQGVILNADPTVTNRTSLNGPNNPAPKGSAITFFAAGAGLWNILYPDGSVVLNPLQPVSGGKAGQTEIYQFFMPNNPINVRLSRNSPRSGFLQIPHDLVSYGIWFPTGQRCER